MGKADNLESDFQLWQDKDAADDNDIYELIMKQDEINDDEDEDDDEDDEEADDDEDEESSEGEDDDEDEEAPQ